MKKQKNMLVALILNLGFSLFELIGGMYTGSVAIISDSLHDLGDAISIGASYLLEKKSTKAPDGKYTYGYGRFSLLGGFITTAVLLTGSVGVIVNAVSRLFNPVEIDYNGMIAFAVIGTAVNLLAMFFTRDGESVNLKAVNLHMLEDVLGWVGVLVGAVVMRFTDFVYLDGLMSLGISLFILVNAVKNLREIVFVFLEKVPDGISTDKVREVLCSIEGVEDVHHIHLRSFDGINIFAELHVDTDGDEKKVKHSIRHKLEEFGISHATIETERPGERCDFYLCKAQQTKKHCCHGHHH